MANNNSILFKKGTHANFEKNVLGKNGGTKNIEAGALYLTTDEGGLYLGLDSDNVKRIQGSVLMYESAEDLLQKVKPPYSTDVIYFIANTNQLVRHNGKDWVVLNRTKQDIDNAFATLQGSVDTIARNLATITPIANDALSKTNGGEVKGNTTFSGKVYASNAPIANTEVANKKYVDDTASALTGTAEDAITATTIHGALNAAAEAKGLANSAQATADGALSRTAGGTVSGETTFTGKIHVSDPTAKTEATNKKYVDDKTSALLGDTNSEAGSDTIKGALKSAAAAQSAADAADKKAVAADKKAVAAQGTADNALEKATDALSKTNGGTVAGATTFKGTTQVTQAPVKGDDVTNKTYVDGKASALLGASGDTAGSATIHGALNAAAEAKTAAATADRKAVAAQNTADSALEKANDAQTAANGAQAAAEVADGKAVTATGLANTAQSTADEAKRIAEAAGAAAATADRKAVAAQNTADGALSKTAGGTVSGNTSFTGAVSLATATISTAPTSGNDVTNKTYVDSAISSAIASNDAMTFKGVVSTAAGLPTTSANKGDTYKVGAAGTYATFSCKIGDLLINNGEDGQKPVWVHVPSGNEDIVSQALLYDKTTNSIFINDGVNTTYAGLPTKLGAFKFVSDNGNLSLNVSSANNVHTITASMVWGSFDQA